MADIAKSAGVPKANVLYYFNSKEELWTLVVDTLWADVDAHFAQLSNGELPATVAGLKSILRGFLECCILYPAYGEPARPAAGPLPHR